MTTETSAMPLPSVVGPNPPVLRSVLFEDRDLLGVSLLELSQYRFDCSEVTQDMLESASLNCFRCEATRWHTAGSNHEGRLRALKHLTLELASQEVGGVDPATLYPTTPLPEGLSDCSGKSLSELRLEIQEMEQKLVHYRSAAGLYAWSYFENLLQLSNAEVDRSTEDSPDEIAPPTREVKTEALLDTLVWATHRFGGVSKALSQISEAATKICDTASGLGPSMADQTNSVVKLSEGLLALTAHVKVNGDNGGPILAVLKQISKNIENATWQVAGQGKISNMSIKEQLLSQGKVAGETQVLTGKALEAIKNMYEGVIALNKNQKEGNQLLKELIEGQRMALRQATQNIAQQQSSAPPPYQAPSVALGSQGGSTIPAAFQHPPPAVAKIPGTNLPQPPVLPDRSPGTAPATPTDDPAPGFKRVKLADGSFMTIPKGWQPDASKMPSEDWHGF